MSVRLDTQRLGLVFQSRPDILEGIRQAADTPSRVSLFNEIAGFVYDQLQTGSEPAQKRRRVDVGSSNGFTAAANGPSAGSTSTTSGSGSAADEAVLLEIKEISVSVPQRKKYDICFTKNYLYARAPGTTGPVQGIVYAWQDIEYSFYLPVPEKSQVQHNYILFPRATCLPPKGVTPTEEPFVFTVPATPPKAGSIAGPNAAAAESVSDSYQSLFNWALTRFSAPNRIEIIAADPQRFHSVIRQPHRPGEKAVHVKAFRGSKDGYLFFLENGILWGFKKPLLFIPLDRIAAVSYTSVLQRTFNIVVEVFAGEGNSDATEEYEFAMLDQEDYPGIDEKYVKRNGLQDRSMADRRKAKLQLAENRGGKKGEEAVDTAGANGHAAGDGMTELERAHMEAEQQLQDDEDEEEEDYDPGSDGESDGSGDSSDDDDDEDDDQDAEGHEGEEEEEGEEGYDEEEE